MNLDKMFHLKENHTDVKTEVMAGITTFMTMAYILAVNPNILEASGMDNCWQKKVNLKNYRYQNLHRYRKKQQSPQKQ